MPKILVTGSAGQVGSVLTPALKKKFGAENVIITSHKKTPSSEGIVEMVDVTDKDAVAEVIKKHSIDTIYHLAGLLSAGSEKDPDRAWQINFGSLKNILDLSRDLKVKRLFWPSSIAAFGPNTPKENTPQSTILEPSTIYGVAKVAGELMCNYYFKKFGVDARSIRYPGLISHAAEPADGTTEYSIWMFYHALQNKPYSCFLKNDTALPMMYMDDAVKATIDLMEASPASLSVRTSYNVTALSFTPEQLASEIKKFIPSFQIKYEPDFHQDIADSWPRSIDDSQARHDWGWQPAFDLPKMTEDMMKNLKAKLGV